MRCLLISALWLSCMCSCASVGVFQSAETLGRKNWEVAVEVSSQAQAGLDSLSLYPVAAVAFRYGLTERLDVGARIGGAGIELATKVMLTERAANATIVSVAPSIGGTFNVPSGVVLGSMQLSLPVLIGVPLSERLQLVLAPKLHDSLFSLSAGQAGGTINTVFAGGAVGVRIQLGRFKFIPGVGFLSPIATTSWRSDIPPGTAWFQGRWVFELSAAFSMGKAR